MVNNALMTEVSTLRLRESQGVALVEARVRAESRARLPRPGHRATLYPLVPTRRTSMLRQRSARRRVAAAFVVPILALPLWLAASAAPANAAPVPAPIVFPYIENADTWVVPAGVTAATFDVYGAAGGQLEFNISPGGRGGRATATIPVTPGSTITIVVGGKGEDVGSCSSGPIKGGFNGGGAGGESVCDGAGGGGASDVRIGGNALSNRVLVAGGGGGASTANSGAPCGFRGGGPGGGLTGGDGLCGGAAGGNQNGSRGSGQLGVGSAGEFGFFLGGGGGGGGYYGGAGGRSGPAPDSFGGGGGSGFGPSGVIFETGVRDGNGEVVVTPLPSPLEQLIALEAAVRSTGRAGITLGGILTSARRALQAGATASTCVVLGVNFNLTAQALVSANQLTQAQATQFIADANRIRGSLGCG
jgi:hypothetical protein